MTLNDFEPLKRGF